MFFNASKLLAFLVAYGSIYIARDHSLPEFGHSYKALESKFSEIFKFSLLISNFMEAAQISGSLGIFTLAF